MSVETSRFNGNEGAHKTTDVVEMESKLCESSSETIMSHGRLSSV